MSEPDHLVHAELEAIVKGVEKFRESQPFDDGCSNWKERFNSIDHENQLTPELETYLEAALTEANTVLPPLGYGLSANQAGVAAFVLY